MSDSNQHRVPSAIKECLIPHSWSWRDDPGGVTATSEHDPKCARCKADAALESLFEQLEALEGRVQAALLELGRASDVRANRTGIIGNVDLILRGSNPASKPEPCESGQHVWKLTMGGDEYACVKCGAFSEEIDWPLTRIDALDDSNQDSEPRE